MCAANMKQMCTGIYYYVQETKGVWPNTVRGNSPNGDPSPGPPPDNWTQNNWAMKILPYMKDVKAFYCPTFDLGPYTIKFHETYAKQYPHSWGGFMSYGMHGGESNVASVKRGFGLFDIFFIRDSEIKVPGDAYMFGETWGYAPGFGMPYTYLVGAKGAGWARGIADNPLTSHLIPQNAKNIEVYGLQFRHRKTSPVGLNWAFVDGHVSWQTGEEMMRARHWALTGDGVNTGWSGYLRVR
jgi:prepilin-type processing-associated H-X9-DG protein